ncbi:LacI family DNA-binding transcriptional regulator [Microbacterium sp. C23T]
MHERAVRRPTLRDVAREAGVAASTASAALSGRGAVRPETRARVQQACQRLAYTRPDPSARFLRRRRSELIAMLLPEHLDAAGWVEVRSLIADCAAVGWSGAVIPFTDHTLETVDRMLLDAVILLGVTDPGIERALAARGIPVHHLRPGAPSSSRTAVFRSLTGAEHGGAAAEGGVASA